MVDSDCRRSNARHGATTGLALLLAVASGCGGQSVSGPEDGGEGGDSGAGAAGKSSNAGSAGVGTGGSGTNGGFAGTP
ncbi:MAG TPA: hypothetical protein VGK73_31940, partial [Polyangiaceae bacterium]